VRQENCGARERGKSKGEEKERKKADKRDHSIVSDSYYNNLPSITIHISHFLLGWQKKSPFPTPLPSLQHQEAETKTCNFNMVSKSQRKEESLVSPPTEGIARTGKKEFRGKKANAASSLYEYRSQ